MSDLAFAEEIAAVEAEVPLSSTWRHVKSGGVYMVVDYCLFERDAKPMVLYSRIEGEAPIWARAATEFLDGRFVRLDAD